MCIKKKTTKKQDVAYLEHGRNTQRSWHILEPADTDAITEAVTHFTTSKQDIA